MANTTGTTPPTPSVTPNPEKPSHERTHSASVSRRSALQSLGWAAVVAASAAAGALAVVTFTGGDHDAPEAGPVPAFHSDVAEHGTIRSIEGTVESTIPARDHSAPNDPSAHSDIAEHGTIRSIEGTIETTIPTTSRRTPPA